MKSIYMILPLMAIITCGCMEKEKIQVNCSEARALYDETCANYDPCRDAAPMSGGIDVQLGLFPPEERFDTVVRLTFSPSDTLAPSRYIFQARDDADEYKWTFPNSNVVETTKEFDLRFRKEEVANRSIPIQLETSINDVKSCLDESQRSASNIRILHFGEVVLESPFRGKYLGRHCDTEEGFREISIVEGYFPGEEYFTGFPYGCSEALNDPRLVSLRISGNKFILVSNEDNKTNICGQPIGTGEFMSDGDQIEFTYRHTYQDGTYEQRCWKGDRI